MQSKPGAQAKSAAEYARQQKDEARASGISDLKKLSRIYQTSWMRARRGCEIKQPHRTDAVARAADAAIHFLKSVGEDQPKQLAGRWSNIVRWLERRLSGEVFRKVDPYSIRAVAGRNAIYALKESGITDRRQMRLAYAKAHWKATPPEQRRGLNKLTRKRYESRKSQERARSKKRRIDYPEYHSHYTMRRMRSDPVFALQFRLRHALYMKLGRARGTDHTADVVGCSWECLRGWVESHFKPGMCWDNRGKWHIDHVFPCAACGTADDIKKSFFYLNLRPMWGVENTTKRNRITEQGLVCAYLCGISAIVIKYDWQIPEFLRARAIGLGMSLIAPI